MSHRASHWLSDIPAESVTHGAFRVMFHLCDAHNSKRPPETACFPSQALLMKATGLSNSGLNKVLNQLEADGLLRRRRTRNADGTQGPTYYILGCDFEEAQPAPLSGAGSKQEQSGGKSPGDAPGSNVGKPVDKSATDSTRGHKPTPLKRASRLHHGGDKPVIEPLKEPQAKISAPLTAPANLIKSGKPFLCTRISAHTARQCKEAGLVTIEEIRDVGIPV
ncbi:hypothetical protein [Leisingera sp.]|uniref:hypothetical protein n=1 Tax=Leisingera sp. TaxID=1879318 RepID=UPI002B264CFB|nr:hypothetical protein [Leisingera sp.]